MKSEEHMDDLECCPHCGADCTTRVGGEPGVMEEWIAYACGTATSIYEDGWRSSYRTETCHKKTHEEFMLRENLEWQEKSLRRIIEIAIDGPGDQKSYGTVAEMTVAIAARNWKETEEENTRLTDENRKVMEELHVVRQERDDAREAADFLLSCIRDNVVPFGLKDRWPWIKGESR